MPQYIYLSDVYLDRCFKRMVQPSSFYYIRRWLHDVWVLHASQVGEESLLSLTALLRRQGMLKCMSIV